MNPARAKGQTSAVVTMTAAGGLTIPAAMRSELGLIGRQRLIACVAEGALVLQTIDAAVESARALLAPHLDGAPSLADELIAERHGEAERE